MSKPNKRPAMCLTSVLIAAAAVQGAQATPVAIDGNSFAVFRADRTANPIGFFAGTSLSVQVRVTPSTSPETRVFVTNDADPSREFEINRVGFGFFAGQHIGQIPYSDALTGEWNAIARNGTDVSMEATRSAFLPIAAMPFVETIGFTGTGNDITVHWTIGDEALLRLDRQSVSIWDITNPVAPFTIQFENTFDTTIRSFELMGLAQDRTYAVEVLSVDHSNAGGRVGATDAFSGTWLSGWRTTSGEVFVPVPVQVPGPASPLFLLISLLGLGMARRRRRSA